MKLGCIIIIYLFSISCSTTKIEKEHVQVTNTIHEYLGIWSFKECRVTPKLKSEWIKTSFIIKSDGNIDLVFKSFSDKNCKTLFKTAEQINAFSYLFVEGQKMKPSISNYLLKFKFKGIQKHLPPVARIDAGIDVNLVVKNNAILCASKGLMFSDNLINFTTNQELEVDHNNCIFRDKKI